MREKHKDLEEERCSRVRQLFGEILHFLWIKGWASEERASKADCRTAQMWERGEHSPTGHRVKRTPHNEASNKHREFWMQQIVQRAGKLLLVPIFLDGANLILRKHQTVMSSGGKILMCSFSLRSKRFSALSSHSTHQNVNWASNVSNTNTQVLPSCSWMPHFSQLYLLV